MPAVVRRRIARRRSGGESVTGAMVVVGSAIARASVWCGNGTVGVYVLD